MHINLVNTKSRCIQYDMKYNYFLTKSQFLLFRLSLEDIRFQLRNVKLEWLFG